MSPSVLPLPPLSCPCSIEEPSGENDAVAVSLALEEPDGVCVNDNALNTVPRGEIDAVLVRVREIDFDGARVTEAEWRPREADWLRVRDVPRDGDGDAA